MGALVLMVLAALAVLLAVACAPAAALTAVRAAPRRALQFGGLLAPQPVAVALPVEDGDDGDEDADEDDEPTTYANYTMYRPFYKVMDSSRVGDGSFDRDYNSAFVSSINIYKNSVSVSTIAGFGEDFNSMAWGFPGNGEIMWAVPDDDTRYAAAVMDNGGKVFAVCETPEEQDGVEVNRMFVAKNDMVWEGVIPDDTSNLERDQFSFPFDGNEVLPPFVNAGSRIQRMVASPDCKYLHIATDDQIWVWDITAGKWHIQFDFALGDYVGLTYDPFNYGQPVSIGHRRPVVIGGNLTDPGEYDLGGGWARGSIRHWNTLTTVGNSLVFAVEDSSDQFNPVYVATPGDRNQTISDATDGAVEHEWIIERFTEKYSGVLALNANSAPTTVPAWPDMPDSGPRSMYPTLDNWFGDILALSGSANNDQSFYFSGKVDTVRYESLLDAMGLAGIGNNDGIYKVFLFNTDEEDR